MERFSNCRFFLTIFALFFALSAFASPLGTTYQAHIVKPDGHALEANNVNFKFSILNPLASCVVYSETFSAINMSDSAGIISFTLGSGVKTYPVSAVTFADVFNNSAANLSCDVGGPVSYSPAASDVRKIVMQFNDGAGWQTLPAMSINAVPYSIFSNDSLKLGGVSATSYVQYTGIPTCSVTEALQYNGSSFSCVPLAGGGVSGTITSTDVISALGYTPVNSSSFTTVTSTVNTMGSSLTVLTSTISAHTASLAAITSSQWLTNASKISYSSGNVGIGTSNPATRLEIANGNGALSGNFDALSISAYSIDWGYPVSATIGLGKTPWNNSWGETMEFSYTSPDPGVLPPTYVFKGSVSSADVVFENGLIHARTVYPTDYVFVNRSNSNNAAYYVALPASYSAYDYFQVIGGTSGLNMGAVSAGAVKNYYVSTSNAGFQIQTSSTNRVTVTSGGLVGIGTTSPITALDVSGGVRVGYENGACAAALAGTLRYTSGNVEFCNGSTWQAFGAGGAVTSSSVISALGYTPANSATVGASITANANSLSALSTLYTALTSSYTSLAASVTALGGGGGGSSQWITRGSDITYTNGNVGVGTTSPTVNLAVGDSLAMPEAQLGDVASATLVEFNGIQSVTTGAKSMVTINSVASTTIQSTAIDSGLAVHMRVSPNQDPGVPLGQRIGYMAINENTTSATVGNLYGNFNIIGNTGAGVAQGLIGNASLIENLPGGNTTIGVVDMNQMINQASMTQVVGSYGVMQNQGDIIMFNGLNYTMWNQGHTADFEGAAFHVSNFVSATKMYGVYSDVSNNSGAEAPEVYGIISKVTNYNTASMTTVYGLYLDKTMYDPATNDYGIYQNDPSKNFFAGRIGIGTSSPVTTLDVSGGIRIGAENAACAVSMTGTLRYMASNIELCNGSSWGTVGASFSNAPNISNASGNITLAPNAAGSVIVSATTASTNSQTGALVVKGGVGVVGDVNVSGTVISNADLVPASSTLLMASCPGGWTDLGLASNSGPGSVTCNGVTCHMCNTSVAAPIPANSQVLMESCPSGWTNLGKAIGPGAAAYVVGSYAIPMVTCQSPAVSSVPPKGLRFLMPSCPASWNDIAATATSSNLANCPTTSCRVCESSQGTTYQRVLFGGDASGTTMYGSDAYVMGGKGGSTSGGGGAVYLRAGNAVDGAGGFIQIIGGSASSTTGTIYNGGSVAIAGGFTPVVSGTGGSVTINGGLNGSGLNGDVFLNGNGGAVYVGNSSSGYQGKLEIRSATNIGSLFPTNISSFANGGLRILNNVAGTVTEAISFGPVASVSGGGAAIAFRRSGTETNIDFYTNNSDLNDGGVSYAATISRLGYFGVGVSTPTAALHAVEKYGTTTTPVAILETTGTNARPYLQFKAEGETKGYVGYGSTGNDSLVLMNYKQAPLIIGVSSTTGIMIDANGRTAVGKISASEMLDVGGNINIGSNDAGPNYIAFHGTNGDGQNFYNHTYIGERMYAGPESSELLLFKGNDSDNTSGPDRIRLAGGNLVFDTYNTPNAVQGSFESIATSVSVTTKMIIKGNGYVGIGNINPAATLDVTGDIRGTGTVATWSDVRAKKDIKVIPDALNKVLQLRGVGFNWRVDEFPEKKFKTTPDIGVIAQEVEKVFPEVVKTNDDGFKSVGYSQLVAPLIEAVKELYYKITGVERKVDRAIASVEQKADKAEVEKLKAENAELKQRLDRLEKMMQQNHKSK